MRIGYDEEPRAWIADLTEVHDVADAVAGVHVYEVFGALTALVYLLLATSLRVVRPSGTALLGVLLIVAGVADALAYSLPGAVAIMPGMVEFLCLPALLVTVGRAGWLNRRTWPVPVSVERGPGRRSRRHRRSGLLAARAARGSGRGVLPDSWPGRLTSDRDPRLAGQDPDDRAGGERGVVQQDGGGELGGVPVEVAAVAEHARACRRGSR